MAETKELPAYVGGERAPFVYFDFVPTYGTLAGAIQIELAASVITSASSTEVVCTGHLRMSPNAAVQLRAAITSALDLLEKTMQPAPPGSVN